MNESEQSEKLGALGAQMTAVVNSVQELRRMIERMSEQSVSRVTFDAAMLDINRRLIALEAAQKDGGFLGGARKARDVAMTLTAILAAVTGSAYLLRNWPGAQ